MTNLLIEQAKKWGLVGFLICTPLFLPSDTVDIRYAQEKFFQCYAMGYGALFFGNIWMTLFMWLNLVLFYLNGCSVGGSQLLSIFLVGILFAASRNFFSKNDLFPYLKAFYIVSALSIGWMIFQSFGIDPINTTIMANGEIKRDFTFTSLSGLLCLPAFNGMYLATAMALIIFFNPFIGFLLAIPALMCDSSAVVLGIASIVIFWSRFAKIPMLKAVHYVEWQRNLINALLTPINWIISHLFISVIVVMLSGFAFYTIKDQKRDHLTYFSRFETWHMIFQKSFIKPLGQGPDSFRSITKRKNFLFFADEEYNPLLRVNVSENEARFMYHSADKGKRLERFKNRIPKTTSFWDNAHNEYLQFFFEYGYFGLLFLGLFIKEMYHRFVLSNKTKEVLALMCCFIAFAAFSTTQFPFHLARLSGVFGVLLGAYWAKTDEAYYHFKESK